MFGTPVGNSAMPVISKQMKHISDEIVTVRTATVVSDIAPADDTQVVLDNDPNRSVVIAQSTSGPLAKGVRVACLAYPPRGLLVLGVLSEGSAEGGTSLVLTCSGDNRHLELGCDYVSAYLGAAEETFRIQPGGGVTRLGGDLVASEGAAYLGSVLVGGEYLLDPNVVINANQIYARNGTTINGHMYVNHASTGNVYLGTSGIITVEPGGILNSSTTYLHLNWTNAKPCAIGSSATVVSRLGGSAGWRCDGPLTVGGLIDGENRIDHVPAQGAAGLVASFTLVSGAGATAVYRLRCTTSSRRFKEDIRPYEIQADKVLALEPKTFQRNDIVDDETGEPIPWQETPREVGFIAEEAEELGLEPWITRDNDGLANGFSYQTFVVAQQVVLREQDKKIKELEAQVKSQEARLARLEAMLSDDGK